MKRLLFLLTIMLVGIPLWVIYSEDLPENALPWGVYTRYRSSAAERDSMRDTLGLNVINLAWDSRNDNDIIDFMNDGFIMYPNQGPRLSVNDPTNYFKYAEAYYSLIEAEDEISNVRFRYHNPQGGSAYGFWYYESQTAATILSSLGWTHRKYNAVINDSAATQYSRLLRMKISQFPNDPLEVADTLAIFYSNMGDYGIDTFLVMASGFHDDIADTFYTEPQIVDCGDFFLDKDRTVSYSIYSTGQAKLYIDYFKVPDQYGIELIDVGQHDAELVSSAYHEFSSNGENKRVAGWYLADEPPPEQFRSLGYIDSLIKAEYPGGNDIPRVTTAFNRFDSSAHGRQTYDFIELADPEAIWADIYPYLGGQVIEVTDTLNNSWYAIYWTTEYTGTVYNTQTKHKGLQKALNDFAYQADYVNQACAENSRDWWLMPQAFSERALDCWTSDGYHYDYLSGWQFRLPTRAELSCCTFMGLCHHAKGMVFWRYHTGVDADTICPSPEKIGLVNLNGTKNDIWYEVKEMMPYIKAIDSTYLSLTWEDAYYINPQMAFPSGKLLNYIHYQSIPASGREVAADPDSGWFHVGEYSEGVGDRYFLLVNRSCSLGPDDPTEAPTKTVFVGLNPAVVGPHLLVIDVADSVYYNSTESTWEAIPETTYTAMMPDSTIPYTTILRAGEGRLYKVVEVDEVEWEGSIQTGIRYQGLINAIGDVSVSAGKTLKLAGPALITMPESDTISMTVNGALQVEGYHSYEVVFGDSLDQHWWGGIMLGRCSSAAIEHNVFNYALTPIETAESCSVDISNSSIYEWRYYGIKNHKSFLEVDSCVFSGVGIYGIYSFAAQLAADGSSFEYAPRYAIYIDGYNNGYDSTIVTGCDIQKTISPYPDSTQYGIYVYNNNKVRIEGNTIRGFNQGGIYVYNSKPKLNDNALGGLTYYGIYATQSSDPNINACRISNITDLNSIGISLWGYSDPKVRWCEFDSLKYGIKFHPSCKPALGDSAQGDTAKWGYNNFEGCSGYYIYQMPIQLPLPLIKAEMNYYGERGPDASKFTGNIDYTPWLTEWSRGGLGKALLAGLPLAFKLNANYPNPFNPTTNISYSLAEAGYTTITIYNILGQKVTTLVDEYKEPGEYSVIWNGCNGSGGRVSSGIYFYRLECGGFTDSKKMLVLR